MNAPNVFLEPGLQHIDYLAACGVMDKKEAQAVKAEMVAAAVRANQPRRTDA